MDCDSLIDCQGSQKEGREDPETLQLGTSPIALSPLPDHLDLPSAPSFPGKESSYSSFHQAILMLEPGKRGGKYLEVAGLFLRCKS